MPCRLGIDVGATNTDFLLFDRTTGATHAHKTRSTPQDPTVGIERGLQELLRLSGVRSTDIEELIHGASWPERIVAQRNGARVGLLTTRGFEQVLHLARGRTDENLTGWAGLPNPQPLADLDMTMGIAERMSAAGDAIGPLDETDAREQIRLLLERGAQAITIVLMHAYSNPFHELRLKSIVRELNPTIPVTLSSELAPLAGEYERALAAVTNAYMQPAMTRYLSDLQSKLSAAQISPRISIAHSAGGTMSAKSATEIPVQTLHAGVGSGARGAALVASMAGFPDALAIDIGGCSADVSLIRKGMARTTNQTVFDTGTANDAMSFASIDTRSCNAGAGMIAHSPIGGMVRVGPHGAGAHPGPACYGNGGAQPTVTDANLVLGRIGSTHSLDTSAANRAVDNLADELGVDRYRAAEGIVNIANEQMAGVLHATALEKDLDAGALALVVSGGAGPLHGGALGVLLQCAVVIVPHNASVLSSLGLLNLEASSQYAQTIGRESSDIASEELVQVAGQLRDKVLDQMSGDAQSDRVSFRLDAGYRGQDFQVSIPVSEGQLSNGFLAVVKTHLADAYKRRFGISCNDSVQLLTLRAIASSAAQPATLPLFEPDGTDLKRAITEHVQVYFDGAFVNTPVFDRSRLTVGAHLSGPAIITQADATTVIHPGQQADVDDYLNLLIRADDGRGGELH